MSKMQINSEQMLSILDSCYEKIVNGIPGIKSCQEVASEYMTKYSNVEYAIQKMVNAQIVKCTTSGFLTSLGGMISLPVALPANIASVLCVQMRMIAMIAYMGGYDVRDDEVQTLIYVCLTGTTISDICKQAGIQIANKTTTTLIRKIPGAILLKINKAVSFRLVTKFGTKGVINLAKMVPIIGGVVGGGIDLASTKLLAQRAYNTFIKGNLE